MYPPQGDKHLGNFIAWDAAKGKIVWSIPEKFSVWSGALATAGGVVFYGTLEGYLKAVDQKTGKELYRFRTPSGIIGNVFTYATRASSTSASIRASVAGPASASPRASPIRPMASAPSAATRVFPSTPHWAARSLSSRCLSASSEV